MKWGLICNLKRKKSLSLAIDVYEFLNYYCEVIPELSLGKEIKKRGYSLENINKKADVVITIGGDGTILKALRTIEKPIFSINSGGVHDIISIIKIKKIKKNFKIL